MKLPFITVNGGKLSRFEEAIQQEWIVTNGLGGWASSTVLGINTRKYHGLLVAALHPPGNRRVCLTKTDEEICVGNASYPLGANEFKNGIFPKGHLFLKEFAVSPHPKYIYTVQNVEVQKTIFMPHEKNAVIILYEVLNGNGFDVKVRVYPLISGRYIHSVINRHESCWWFSEKHGDAEVELAMPQHMLIMKTTGGCYCKSERWIEGLYYREEASRGESCLDDCYQPGYFEVKVKALKRESFALIATADENEINARKILDEISNVESIRRQELKRSEDFLAKFYMEHEGASLDDWLKWIVLATDMFIVKGKSETQRFVVAGYHWFESWGRDTFISLPGLMLVTGKFENAREAFLTFKKYCRQGLMPNLLSDQLGQPLYNTVDATLWFVNAVLQYLKYTCDFKFVKEQLWETLKAIIENHVKGTMFNIHVDSDGLLSHGPQLTWMDATVDGQPVNPRDGKAVEVQALWYNALKTMELIANKLGEKNLSTEYALLAEKAKKSFAEKFWNAEKGYLFDVVNENGRDDSLMPNQVLAVALDFTMLDNEKGGKIVDAVQRELLTPYGLRTLARNNPRYIGVYCGDRRSRDKAYHNGTVWPWLLGPFTTAYLKTKGYSAFTCEYALKNFLLPLFTKQIVNAGLGVISEIFDGDPPHTARGCIAQAWSIAEPFRAYVEDIMLFRPKHEKEILGLNGVS
ncbi:MAG: amylo-alpha-1,6-glucosidase [Candidatus Bathyarchaeia archaeon]